MLKSPIKKGGCMQLLDLTGEKYGDWIVVGRSPDGKRKYHSWVCRCKCGKEKVLDSYYIRKVWKPTDCGCSNSIIGKKFGMLIVLEKLGKKCNTLSNFKCVCECGEEKITRGAYLLNGQRKSCGCYLSKEANEIGPNRVYNHYKQASKKRGIDFQLSKEELKDIIEKECVYCGKTKSNEFKMKNTKKIKNRFYAYNGIDRVNNEIGYVTNNCVSCCNICNLMKREMSYKEWINQIKTILEYNQQTASTMQTMGAL
jgi:hypothetical protein